MTVRRLLAAALFLGVLVGARPSFAQGRTDVDKARAMYLQKNYPEAEKRLRALIDPSTGLKDTTLLSQARMYLVATLMAEGKRDEAQEILSKLILEDSTFEPDPLSFPSDVINTFFDVRTQLQEKLRQDALDAARREAEKRAKAEEDRRRQEAWLARVKQMATEEKITTRNTRLVALLPFGAGQFQNREPVLGYIFLGTESALALGTLITVPMFVYADGRANGQGADLEHKAAVYKDRADTIRTVNLSLVGALAAVAIGGIVQANVAYVPEISEVKKRELPPQSKALVPVAGPLVGGGFVGISGAF